MCSDDECECCCEMFGKCCNMIFKRCKNSCGKEPEIKKIPIEAEQPKPLLQITLRELEIPEIKIPAFNIKKGSISREGNKYKITDKKTSREHTFLIQGRKRNGELAVA
jgi:hypothetical protein